MSEEMKEPTWVYHEDMPQGKIVPGEEVESHIKKGWTLNHNKAEAAAKAKKEAAEKKTDGEGGTDSKSPLDKLTVEKLTELAGEHDIQIPPGTKKPEIIAMLEAAGVEA